MKKFYEDEDINDIIESEEEAFFKGGVGSGQKGHTTAPDPNAHLLSSPGNHTHHLGMKRQRLKHLVASGKHTSKEAKMLSSEINAHKQSIKMGHS